MSWDTWIWASVLFQELRPLYATLPHETPLADIQVWNRWNRGGKERSVCFWGCCKERSACWVSAWWFPFVIDLGILSANSCLKASKRTKQIDWSSHVALQLMSLVSLGIGGQNLQIVDSYTVSLFFSHFFPTLCFVPRRVILLLFFKSQLGVKLFIVEGWFGLPCCTISTTSIFPTSPLLVPQ